MNALVRLGLAWLLMLAGAVFVVDSGVAESRWHSRTLAVLEAFGGLAVLAGGAMLRRTATGRGPLR